MLQLTFEKAPHPDDIQILGDSIMAYAKQQKELQPLDFFSFFIRDHENTILGGCNGCALYGCLYIDQLWVSDSLRQQGWGTKLTNAALNYGQELGCTFAAVNTFDWEALGFYQKMGFKIEFQRRGFHKNSVFYFLRQDFLAPASNNQQEKDIEIRPFIEQDIPLLVQEFARHHWHKPESTFELYYQEQQQQERHVWLAFYQQQLAGYITLKWNSYYQPFSNAHIPEIMDLNVLPPYRNKGIATQLLDKAEAMANTRSQVIGIGVGLYSGYGQAQKLYIKRGYLPDGQGLTYNYKPIPPGESVPLDDDLVLWFTK
jgi:ribosomal protein S18 acetylase RimI-like enzyme